MKTIVALISICAVSAFANDSTIVTELRARMEAGDIDAQIQLARIYNRGQGVIRSDFEEAERLLRPLAEQGNARARLELGYLYDPENGQMRDLAGSRSTKIIDSLTKEWFRALGIAAFPDSILARDSIQKSLESTNLISREYSMYEVYPPIKPYGGATLPDSIQKRIRDSVEIALSSEQWFLKAANQGLPEAMCALAWLMERGRAWTSRSLHDEFYWYEKAAEQDYTYAQSYLGEFYSFPIANIKNLPRAYFWLKLASDKNDKRARSNFEQVKKEITEDELKEAEKLLDDWHKRKER